MVKGTPEERGIITFSGMDAEMESETPKHEQSTRSRKMALYDFPLISDFLKRNTWTSYFPVSPTFRGMCNFNLIERLRQRVYARELKSRTTETAL